AAYSLDGVERGRIKLNRHSRASGNPGQATGKWSLDLRFRGGDGTCFKIKRSCSSSSLRRLTAPANHSKARKGAAEQRKGSRLGYTRRRKRASHLRNRVLNVRDNGIGAGGNRVGNDYIRNGVESECPTVSR